MTKMKSETPRQIEIVPCSFIFTVRLADGSFIREPGAVWCGTEAEALAKKAELEKSLPVQTTK